MYRKRNFVADFETTTSPEDCRVWAFGFMEIGNKKNFKIGNNMDDFMTWLFKSRSNIYFHNLKFDGSFIVNWLLHNGWTCNESGDKGTFDVTISDMNQWYKIDISLGHRGKNRLNTVVYDSLKKLPFSVDRIGKAFKLDSRKIKVEQEFYTRHREINHKITDIEYQYIYKDLEVMADALKTQFESGLEKMTIGGDSLFDFKSTLGGQKNYRKYFPELSIELDKNLRMAYKGGFTWVNKRYQGKIIKDGIVFDVNSLYPYVMYDKFLPIGIPIPIQSLDDVCKDYPLFIVHIRCEFILKKNHIPTIQIKHKQQNLVFAYNEYLESSDGEIVDLYLTNVDYELFIEHYNVYDFEVIDGWKFRQIKGIFKNFIEKWSFVKATETGALRELAKLMLNSLYGKFCKNPNVTGKKPVLNEDGANMFVMEEEKFSNTEYTPMGAFITAYARDYTIRTAQSVFDRIIYCDTDSLHLTGTDIPKEIEHIIDPNKLGFWDYEATFKKAKYIRQKSYCQFIYVKHEGYGEDKKPKYKNCTKEEHSDTIFKVTCAGMTDKVKDNVTFDTFEKGFSSYGKLMPRQVHGGVVLIDSKFTLK